jgi:phosphoinositide-3-kinase regulatory subunit 4
MSRECSSANVEPTCQLLAEREALLDIPNVYSYQTFIDSDKAGYLIRQWVASNLYDRIR